MTHLEGCRASWVKLICLVYLPWLLANLIAWVKPYSWKGVRGFVMLVDSDSILSHHQIQPTLQVNTFLFKWRLRAPLNFLLDSDSHVSHRTQTREFFYTTQTSWVPHTTRHLVQLGILSFSYNFTSWVFHTTQFLSSSCDSTPWFLPIVWLLEYPMQLSIYIPTQCSRAPRAFLSKYSKLFVLLVAKYAWSLQLWVMIPL